MPFRFHEGRLRLGVQRQQHTLLQQHPCGLETLGRIYVPHAPPGDVQRERCKWGLRGWPSLGTPPASIIRTRFMSLVRATPAAGGALAAAIATPGMLVNLVNTINPASFVSPVAVAEPILAASAPTERSPHATPCRGPGAQAVIGIASGRAQERSGAIIAQEPGDFKGNKRGPDTDLRQRKWIRGTT